MLTLGQHNESMRKFAEMLRNQNKAGVACDKCGSEMVYANKTTHANGQHVECPSCQHRGFKQEGPAPR